MKFSVVHPTARVTDNFPSPWWVAFESVADNCDSPEDVEYIVVVHKSRIDAFRSSDFDRFARFTVVVNRGRDCLIDQCNAGLLAAHGEIQCWTQDDLRFPPHWDSEIKKLIPDTSQLVCLQAKTDGGRTDLLMPSIMTTRLSNAIGLCCTEYLSMCADVEWSTRARMLGRVIGAPDLYFPHLHPINKTADVDEIYLLENSLQSYQVGHEVFEKRKALGFPRVPFPDDASREVAEVPPSIAFMLPGESFRFEWLASLLELGVAVGDSGWAIQRFLGYTSSCYSTRINLSDDLLEKSKLIPPKYVFWLDDDNLIKPEQFMRLLNFLESNPQADGIVGWCWIRHKERWSTSCGNFWTDDGVHLAPMELSDLYAGGPSPKPIDYSGFPAVLLRYEVMKHLGSNAFRPYTARDAGVSGVLTGEQVKRVGDHWFAGEDTSFFLRAREQGMRFFVHPDCKVAHLKMHSQEPDIQLYADTPVELKQWREQVNGKAVPAVASQESGA